MYEYIYLVVIFIIVGLFAYIKINYPFWNVQPVFHTYDFWRYYTQNPFLIQHGFPIKTKFCDINKIRTFPYSELTLEQRDQFVDLLQCHYISSERIMMTATTDTIHPYMTGHNNSAYISFYNEPQYTVVDASSGTIIQTPETMPGLSPELSRSPTPNCYISIQPITKPIGCISSRPVRLFLYKKYVENTEAKYTMNEIPAYFFDHICVHRDHRDKKYSRNLIQTHEYYQRIKNPEILVSLFKKEEDLCQGIVPLTEFKTYTFYLRNVKIPRLPKHFVVVRIFKENLGILTDFLYEISHPPTSTPLFSACAIPDIGSLTALINQNQLFVYALRRENIIFGIYFLKDTKIEYEDVEGGKLLECVASISNTESQGKANGLFFAGFLHALRGIMDLKQTLYKMILFDDTGHNGRILEKWRWKYTPIFQNRAAYYIYNMVVPNMPLARDQCLFLQ